MPPHAQLLLFAGHDYRKKGLAKHVHFLGPVADMAQLYRPCDVLLHPTTQDAYPMVVLEAIGNGLPVVTTPAPYNALEFAQVRAWPSIAEQQHALYVRILNKQMSA